MKFCMVTTFYPPFNFGGDGIFVYRLSNELARRGHRVDVVHCLDSFHFFDPATPADSFPCHPNVHIHRLKSRLGFLSPLLTHQTGRPMLKKRKLGRILSGSGYDVIHYHNISLVGGPGILAVGQAVKLYTNHEYWLVCPLSILWKFKRRPCVRKNCFFCMIHAGRPPQIWRYSGLLEKKIGHVDAFISPGKFMIEKIREMGLDVPMEHIPNFLPEPLPEPMEEVQEAPLSTRPYFLFVGRLEKNKGLQVLIRAIRRHGKSRLLIAGKGGYVRTLRRLARGADLIEFLGQQSSGELGRLYRNAVAVVVPSLWSEPFGQVVIEAFSHRTPVIVHRSGALPEIVDQSGGGLVYDSEAGLLEALGSLASNAGRRDDLGDRGYRAFRRFWTAERHIQVYLDLIQEVAAKKGGQSV